MNQQQLRTVHLSSTQHEEEDVLVAAVGTLRRTVPGRSVQETLKEAGIPMPTSRQTVRVNNEEVRDLGQILRPGDKLTIVNRVIGG